MVGFSKNWGAAGAPDQVTDPVPSSAPPLPAYRFAVAHTHAGVHYAAGARVSLTASEAAHINDYVGAGTVLADERGVIEE